MTYISKDLMVLIRGCRISGKQKPKAATDEQWDSVEEPPITRRQRKISNSQATTTRHLDPHVLKRINDEERIASGLGCYPLREKWANKPYGAAVTLPHLRCMEEKEDAVKTDTQDV